MDEPIRCEWFPYCRCGMAIGTGRVEICFPRMTVTFGAMPDNLDGYPEYLEEGSPQKSEGHADR